MILKIILKTFIIAIIKTLSFGSLYFIQPYLYNIYINAYYIDKLNILFVGLLLIKCYISFTNYINLFKLLNNIYYTTKYIFLLYSIFVNNDYRLYLMDDIDDSSNISINLDNDQSNKKIQIIYIKDLLFLYLTSNLSYIFKLKYNPNLFINKIEDKKESNEYKELYKYIEHEIKQINFNNNIDNIRIIFIELLILKSFSNLKKINYINYDDYTTLTINFKKLQKLILQLHNSIENYNIYHFIIIITYITLFISIISIYIQYLNNDIYSFLYTILINFIIIYLDDMINISLNISLVLSKIFDFDKYLKELYDDIYIINYLYPIDNEYSL